MKKNLVLVVLLLGICSYFFYLHSKAANRIELYNEFISQRSSDDAVFLIPEIINLEHPRGESILVEVECGRLMITASSREYFDVSCWEDKLLVSIGSLELRVGPFNDVRNSMSPDEMMAHMEYHASRIPDYENMMRMGDNEFSDYMAGLVLKSLAFRRSERIVIVYAPEFTAILGFANEYHYASGFLLSGGALFSVFFSDEASHPVQDDIIFMLNSVAF